MHAIIGGAHHGKQRWIQEQLIRQRPYTTHLPGGALPDDGVLLVTGLEDWLQNELSATPPDPLVEKWTDELERLHRWEASREGREVIVVITDLSKGIVPMDKQMRLLRDTAGWCHQRTASKADRITRIWYGIAEQLK